MVIFTFRTTLRGRYMVFAIPSLQKRNRRKALW